MPSTEEGDRRKAVSKSIEKYLLVERSLRVMLILLISAVTFATYVASSLAPAVAVAAGMVLIVRAPILQLPGPSDQKPDADIETVTASFSGDMPPILAFQWGLADDICSEGATTTYRISHLFDTQSAEMTVETRSVVTPEQTQQVEIEVFEGDSPWARYQVSVRSDAGQTAIEYEYQAGRRFSVLRLLQRTIANRYRDTVLAAQKYELRD